MVKCVSSTWQLLPLLLPLLSCSQDGGGLGLSTPDPATDNQNTGAGAYAYDYLTNDTYNKLYIEVDYIADDDESDGIDYAPSPESMEFLIDNLKTFCNKPDGIIYNPADSTKIPVQRNADGSVKTDFTYDELNNLELEYRNRYHSGDEAVLYFLYINGRYVLDDGTPTSAIGFAHHGSSMVVLKGIVNSALPVARTFYEKTVVVHEVGHLLGLVTTGIPAVNDAHVDPSDEARGSHCIEEHCMMHWAVGPDDLLDSFLSGEDPDFDQCCRDDISFAGGKSTATGTVCLQSSTKKGREGQEKKVANHRWDPYHPQVVF